VRVVVSWSGGKDSCLACYEAVAKGFEVSGLLNFVFKDSNAHNPRKVSSLLNFVLKDSSTHSPRKLPSLLNFVLKNTDAWTMHKASPEVVNMQAKATGIPIIQRETSWSEFEDTFKLAMLDLKPADIEGSVWGLEGGKMLKRQNSLDPQKEWICRVCSELGIKPIMPLWGRSQEQILNDFVEEGFEAILVSVNARLGVEWLGRKIDRDFLLKIRGLKHEKRTNVYDQLGGCHTFVTDGPLFQKRLKVLESKIVAKNNYFFLNISKVKLVEKDKHDRKMNLAKKVSSSTSS
jgi:diphthine-ammonia ligase